MESIGQGIINSQVALLHEFSEQFFMQTTGMLSGMARNIESAYYLGKGRLGAGDPKVNATIHPDMMIDLRGNAVNRDGYNSGHINVNFGKNSISIGYFNKNIYDIIGN